MRYRSVNELTKNACWSPRWREQYLSFVILCSKVMFGQAMKYINNSYFVSSPSIFIGVSVAPKSPVFPAIHKKKPARLFAHNWIKKWSALSLRFLPRNFKAVFVQGLYRHSRSLANISLKAKRQRDSFFRNRSETMNNGIEVKRLYCWQGKKQENLIHFLTIKYRFISRLNFFCVTFDFILTLCRTGLSKNWYHAFWSNFLHKLYF